LLPKLMKVVSTAALLPKDWGNADLNMLLDHVYFETEPMGRDQKGRPAVRPGQLVCAHQVYPPSEPYIVSVEGHDPLHLGEPALS